GWGMITQLATVNTLIQTDVPDDLRGRVMSLYTLVFLGFIPVGNLIVGTMAHYLGTPRAVAVSASACLVIFTVIVGIKKDLLSY
ncbi:MAG: MFS transporter, partial [Nitrospirae bacterium]|nr:MFS transporter [Nitrospirota bacterium]